MREKARVVCGVRYFLIDRTASQLIITVARYCLSREASFPAAAAEGDGPARGGGGGGARISRQGHCFSRFSRRAHAAHRWLPRAGLWRGRRRSAPGSPAAFIVSTASDSLSSASSIRSSQPCSASALRWRSPAASTPATTLRVLEVMGRRRSSDCAETSSTRVRRVSERKSGGRAARPPEYPPLAGQSQSAGDDLGESERLLRPLGSAAEVCEQHPEHPPPATTTANPRTLAAAQGQQQCPSLANAPLQPWRKATMLPLICAVGVGSSKERIFVCASSC